MAVSDSVIANLTTVYVAVIAGIKAYGLVFGRSYGCGLVLIMSTTLVAVILVATLTWDVSRKATYALSKNHSNNSVNEPCKGGICWHGVAVKSPVSQLRFSLPHNELLLRHRHHQYDLGKILIKQMPQTNLITEIPIQSCNQQVLKRGLQCQHLLQNTESPVDSFETAECLLLHFAG